MKTYPETITAEILRANAQVTDQDILVDIRDTEYEIAQKEEEVKAYEVLARTDHMADFRRAAAESSIDDHKNFAAFLKRLLEARKQIEKVETDEQESKTL